MPGAAFAKRVIPIGLAALVLAAALPVSPAGADPAPAQSLRIACHPTVYTQMAMEWSASKGRCWMHSGHHTYYLNGTYTLDSGSGFLDSVEQQFSPPTEYTSPPFDSPVAIEVSLDGQTWTVIEEAVYEIVSLPPETPVLETRQRIFFTLPAHDEPFRYLRVHAPRSAAQGLSGFLDISRIDILIRPVATVAPSAPQSGTFAFSCLDGDILEDFFAAHPCSFGGVNRYDSPSFFHTYPLGDGASNLSRISGVAQAAPWRTDDFFLPVGSVGQAAGTILYVQTSADGEVWETVGSVSVPGWSVPVTFDIALDSPKDAAFVRLHPDYHPAFDNYVAQPSLHHLEAFLTASAIEVDGMLPG